MSAAHAHQPDPTPTAARLERLVEGVYAWIQPDGSWWVNNAGAIHGGDMVVIVDTCATAERTRRFLDAVALATDDAPVRIAGNTHEHGDHTYGNCLLPPEAALIGHENMRSQLLGDPIIDGCPPVWDPVPDWGPVTRRVPDIVTRSALSVFAGTRRIDFLHPGHAAHTTGDLVAWLPEERVLYSGDLIFHGLTPLVMAGSVRGARRSLTWLAAFQPDQLVPGHGPVVHATDLSQVLSDHDEYYGLILAIAEAGIAEGASPLQAAQDADLGRFAAWADSERIVLNLHRAYAELQDGVFDILAAITDTVTFNGGPMTTHVCCRS